MGSPLSPVIADFYMEAFKKKALDAAPYKPCVYKHYVDDTFQILSHVIDRLMNFVTFLNNLHDCIKFTMGIIALPRYFVDQKPDGTLW